MSKAMANKIKKWYPRLWKLDQVKDAVIMKVITEDEYKEITGMDYDTPSEVNTDTSNEVSSNSKEE